MKNFKQLMVWQKGFWLALECYQFTRTFPKDEKFGLISQINRSASSIPANIAEGSSRSSEKEYRRFLEIALGSSFELETQLLLSGELGFGISITRESILCELYQEIRMLTVFMNKLQK